MRQVTIKDLAKKLGLSVSTISRALNNHPDIKESTKKMVSSLANEMGYSPNVMARNLKAKYSNQIGVLVPEITHNFFAQAISGIEEVAYKEGFTVIVAQSNEDVEREKVNVNSLYLNRVAGLIVSLSQTTESVEHLQEVIDKGISLVAFDRINDKLDVPKIIVNDYQASYDAVKYLISKGYKKIAHFAGPENLLNCVKRLEGYKDALTDSGFKLNEDLICVGGMHEADGANLVQIMLEKKVEFDAIFAVNDPVAIGAMIQLKKANIKIPGDVGLMGFSDNPIAGYLDPSLTTIAQPAHEMGKLSAEKLIEMIRNDGKDEEPFTRILDTELIIRQSTK